MSAPADLTNAAGAGGATSDGAAAAATAAAASTDTLTAVLARRAATAPDALGFAYLPDGLHEEGRLTWAQLHERTLALAAILVERVPAGGRVMLLVPPGLENVIATQACFAARLVGVPVAPPNPRRPAQGLADLQRVALDAGVSCVLATREVETILGPVAREAAPALAAQPWVLVDEAPHAAPSTTLPAPLTTDLAYLQYTSGSTSAPRGVMLTHAQFNDNLLGIRRRFAATEADSVYSWLPPWHDMGLVTGVFMGINEGMPTRLAPPNAIARRPHHWLQALSELRITLSGAPDFMYRACVARAAPELVASLDLSAWRRAYCGSEPVRAATLEAFMATFAPAGFAANALAPAYGMAESTLFVSCTSAGEPPLIRSYDRGALAAGRATPVAAGTPGAVAMVGNGVPEEGGEVIVVDPESGARLPGGAVGEAWIRSASVGTGYWGHPEATERTFGAELEGEPGTRWLRSGDVAFIDEGQVFIAGRLKDVLILNGVKRHAVDLELAAQESDPRLAARPAAAFSVDDGDAERVVITLEAPREPLTEEEAAALLAGVRRAIAATFDVMPDRIVLADSGSIPKTTSGKVQRGRTRAALDAAELPIAWEWSAKRGSTR